MSGAIHPLDDVRGLQEEAKEKARWTLIVREQISTTLLSTGYFHSDDLEPLGIPEQHRNIAGSQIGSYVSRDYMQEVGRRKSIKPSRKAAKSAIYKITEKGRQELSKLVGVDAGNRPDVSGLSDQGGGDASPLVGVDPGESGAGGHGGALPPSHDVGNAGSATPETLSLLPEPPRLIDPDQRAA